VKIAARIAGHPLHPALVHFPIALWSATWVWDVLGASTGAAGWWQTGYWCLVAGVVMALPAAVTGLMELLALEERHPAMGTATRHMLIMGCAFAAYLGALLVRGGPLAPEGWRLPAALGLSTLGLALLAVGGWFGGRLVYWYGVGRAKPPDL
jgi:uncharacterized membrane protein